MPVPGVKGTTNRIGPCEADCPWAIAEDTASKLPATHAKAFDHRLIDSSLVGHQSTATGKAFRPRLTNGAQQRHDSELGDEGQAIHGPL